MLIVDGKTDRDAVKFYQRFDNKTKGLLPILT